MDIYVVQPGDNIDTIAAKFGMPADRLIQDNGIDNPNNLVIGQTIVIAYPTQTHIVQAGETLADIAEAYGITVIKLLRNNPFLSDREFIYPGETLTISYNTGRKITTNGIAFSFIDQNILRKTLPFLTYLSFFNYQFDMNGNITRFYDDTAIVQIAKQYSVVPLMLVSSLSSQGSLDFQVIINILLNEQAQDRLTENALNIIKTRGYYGINLTFTYLNETTLPLYIKFLTKVYNRIKPEGYYVFITINPAVSNVQDSFAKIDYSPLVGLSDKIIFLKFSWASNFSIPGPISSNSAMKDFLKYVTSIVPSSIIDIGIPTIGYDWAIPSGEGKTVGHSLTLDAAIRLARDTGSTIQFDEISQTPFFEYSQIDMGSQTKHIVWFIDARSINSLADLVVEYGLSGTGVWNIMIFYAQLWLVINSQYEIETKLE